MSLIKCPECEREVSDTAKTCINCGYQIMDNSFNTYMNNKINNSKETIQEKQQGKFLKAFNKVKNFTLNNKIISIMIALIFLFCAIGLPIIFSNYGSNKLDNIKIKVTSISIQSAENVLKVKAGDSLQFSIIILPLNATYENLSYEIIIGSNNANISNSGLLIINSNATDKETITLKAVVDNISSNVFQIEIINNNIKITELNNEKNKLSLEKSELIVNSTSNENIIKTNLEKILQWEIDLITANNELNAIYADRNVSMFIGGQWIWTFDAAKASQQEKIVKNIQENINNTEESNLIYKNNIIYNNMRIAEINNELNKL